MGFFNSVKPKAAAPVRKATMAPQKAKALPKAKSVGGYFNNVRNVEAMMPKRGK